MKEHDIILEIIDRWRWEQSMRIINKPNSPEYDINYDKIFRSGCQFCNGILTQGVCYKCYLEDYNSCSSTLTSRGPNG